MELKGMIVTADALQTQVKNARFIVEDKGADYIFPVKQNQENLFETIRNILVSNHIMWLWRGPESASVLRSEKWSFSFGITDRIRSESVFEFAGIGRQSVTLLDRGVKNS